MFYICEFDGLRDRRLEIKSRPCVVPNDDDDYEISHVNAKRHGKFS